MAKMTEEIKDEETTEAEAAYARALTDEHLKAILKGFKTKYPDRLVAPLLFTIIAICVDRIAFEIKLNQGTLTPEHFQAIEEIVNQQIMRVKRHLLN